MPKAERDRCKRVGYFTPCVFSGTQRKKEDAGTCNLLVIDMDDEGAAMAKVYIREPGAIAKALAPYSFAAYTTASHRPDAPRIRVVVDAEGVPASRYAEAVRTVAQSLALPQVTRESLTPCQAMFLPVLFRDEDACIEHPLFALRLDGESFREECILDADFPAEVVKPAAVSGEDSHDLEFLSAPVAGITLSDAQDALAALDPDMPYSKWLEVAAALRHQFPKAEEAAYGLFDAWSAKGKKYVGEKDTFLKWNSLKPHPKGRKPITFRTLHVMSAQAGWANAPVVVARLSDACRAWIKEPERTTQELVIQGARKIAALPSLTGIEQDALIASLTACLRKRGLPVQKAAVAKDVARFAQVVFTPADSAKATIAEDKLPQWLRGCTYVAQEDSFLYRHSERRYEPQAFNSFFNVNLMPQKTEDGEPGKPIMPAAQYALNVARIPRVDRTEFDPARQGLPVFMRGDLKLLNSYLPTYPEPETERSVEAAELLESHCRTLFGEYAPPLLDWMAFQVQEPGRTLRWAPLLQGAQGCGKTLLAQVLSATLGETNVRMTDAHLLFSEYTSWAYGAQVVVFEEIRITGASRYDILNKLKPVITNDVVTVHAKYQNPYTTPNKSNYLLLTNHQDALPIGESDRRYFVLFSRIQTRLEVERAFPAGYFDKFFTFLKEAPGAFRFSLLERKLQSSFNPDGHAPRTVFVERLNESSASPVAVALRDGLSSGEPREFVAPDIISLRAAKDIAYEAGVKDAGQAVAAALREMGFEQCESATIGGVLHKFYMSRDTGLASAGREARLTRIQELCKAAKVEHSPASQIESIL
jgi:hypothetical protein